MREPSILSKTIKLGLYQLLMFALIPFIVYLFAYQDVAAIPKLMGLYFPADPNSFILAFVIIAPLSKLFQVIRKYIYTNKENDEYLDNVVLQDIRKAGQNKEAFFSILFTGMITNGLSEEILFRGFIAKGLIALFGYLWGNIIQAIIFSLIHSVYLYYDTKRFSMALFEFIRVFIIAFAIGYVMVYLANGSILPLWIEHGVMNTFGYYHFIFKSKSDCKEVEVIS